MPLTLSQLLRQDNRRRVILVELDYVAEVAGAPVTQTLYLANSIAPAQAAATIVYEDCVNSVPNFQRSLSGPISTVYSSSLGSIEIDNADGEKDFLLSVALDGSQARFYVWDAGTTTLVYQALCLRASAPSFDRISIALKDAGVLLNKSVGGTTLVGGSGPNAERWRPVNFGYVHNLQAQIVDEPLLIYVHSDTGTNTAAVDVRDKGVSVLFTDLGDGTFQLDASPAGIITCDVVATYDGTDATRRVSDLLQFLIDDRLGANAGEGFDGAGPTFTVGDADDYLVGLSISDARNIIDVLNQVCDSGNCFWAIKRTGEFTYGRLRPNSIGDFGFTTATIKEDDYDEGSWHIEHDQPLYYLLQAYMSRNWYKQTDFAGVLTPDEQAVFTRPGIFLLQETAVGTAYADIPEAYDKTLSISPALDTILSGGFGELDLPYLADWMETRRFMQLPWIERLSITVGLEFYFLELGDPVSVIMPRYGMDGGELFQVISININLTAAKIDLILLRRHTAEPLPPGWVRITAATEIVTTVKAYQPLISVIPPPGGGDHPCGTPFFVGGDLVFIPCPGTGGGGGPIEIPHQQALGPLFFLTTDVDQTVGMTSNGGTAAVGNPALNYPPTAGNAAGGIIAYTKVAGIWTNVYEWDAQAGGEIGEDSQVGYQVSISDVLHMAAAVQNAGDVPEFVFLESDGVNSWSPEDYFNPAGTGFTSNVHFAKISRDGNTIVVGQNGGGILEFYRGGPGSWALVATYTGASGDWFTDFAMTPDAATVALSNQFDTGSGIEGRVLILVEGAGPSWSLQQTLVCGGVTSSQAYQPIVMTPPGGLDAAWSATANEVIIVAASGEAGGNKILEVWRVDPFTITQVLWSTINGGYAWNPYGLTIADDGQALIMGDVAYPIDANTGRILWTPNLQAQSPTLNVDASIDVYTIANPYLASGNDSQWGRSLSYGTGQWLVAGSRYPDDKVDFYDADFSLFVDPPPANDDFADAITITAGGPVSNVTTSPIFNRWATVEVGEPDHAATGGGPHHTIWWKVTLAANGTIDLDTTLSTELDGITALDTTLAIYSGATVGSLVEIASNDDGASPPTSDLTAVALTGGVTYHIAVGTFDDIVFGSVILRYSLSGATL